jgi:hypothetical protein
MLTADINDKAPVILQKESLALFKRFYLRLSKIVKSTVKSTIAEKYGPKFDL